VFCDVDPATLNPTASHIAAALTPRTGGVVVLHYGGAPGEIAEIAELCRARGIPLVEDAACAVASTVDGRPCGTLGDIGIWSFDSMKILVTGDGGMIYCRDPEAAAHMRKLAYLGMDQSSGYGQAATGDRWWEFEVVSFSRRSIVNDITAAIGCVQLRRLPAFVERRSVIAKRYDEALSEVPGVRCPPPLPPGHASSHLFYWIQLDPRFRDAVARRLYDRGIYTTFRYLPLHCLPIYRAEVRLPGAEAAASRTLCIPIHQGLDDEAVDLVIQEVTRAVHAEMVHEV
jgi:aminotransferase